MLGSMADDVEDVMARSRAKIRPLIEFGAPFQQACEVLSHLGDLLIQLSLLRLRSVALRKFQGQDRYLMPQVTPYTVPFEGHPLFGAIPPSLSTVPSAKFGRSTFPNSAVRTTRPRRTSMRHHNDTTAVIRRHGALRHVLFLVPFLYGSSTSANSLESWARTCAA